MQGQCARIDFIAGVLVALLILTVPGQDAAAVPTPAFMGLGGPTGGSIQNQAWGVSADGSTAVGRAGGNAYRWRVGPGMQFITNGSAYAASADGSVVVGRGLGNQAFRWTQASGAQSMGSFPGAGSQTSSANAVSANGTVVAGTAPKPSPPLDYDPFRWTAADGMQSLGDVSGGRAGTSVAFSMSSNAGVIVGQTFSALAMEAFRWTAGSGMTLLSGVPAGFRPENAAGVSGDGTTIVGYTHSPNTQIGMLEAYRWTEAGGLQALGDLPGGHHHGAAWAVSGDGSIIVGQSLTDFDFDFPEAFIWDAVHGMRNLREVLEQDFGLNLDGWMLNAARGISADGNTIVGYGVNPQGFQESWIAVIPEPASLALFLLTLLPLTRRRR